MRQHSRRLRYTSAWSGRARVLVFALVTAAIAAACSGTDGGGHLRIQAGVAEVPTVDIVEIRHGSIELEERLAGSVLARHQTEIRAEIDGVIVDVLADDGDWVEAGAPLARLDPVERQARVDQAVAALDVAEARVGTARVDLERARMELKRLQAVFDRGLGSLERLDNARAAVAFAEAELALRRSFRAQAEAELAARRVALGMTIVSAPVTGAIEKRAAVRGRRVRAGEALFVIGDTREPTVRVPLTSQMLGYIRTGQHVRIRGEVGPGPAAAGSITHVDPFVHPLTQTTEARIRIDGDASGLRPGMFVTVDVIHGRSAAGALVPVAAIRRHPIDDRTGVYVVSLPDGGDGVGSSPGDDGHAGASFVQASMQAPAADVPASGSRSGDEPDTGPSSQRTPVRFVPITVVARGRRVAVVEGVGAPQWVVISGHRYLARGAGVATVVPARWPACAGDGAAQQGVQGGSGEAG